MKDDAECDYVQLKEAVDAACLPFRGSISGRAFQKQFAGLAISWPSLQMMADLRLQPSAKGLTVRAHEARTARLRQAGHDIPDGILYG